MSTESQTSKVLKTFEVSPAGFKTTEIGDIPAEWDVACKPRLPKSVRLRKSRGGCNG
jgi:hypothetical protein